MLRIKDAGKVLHGHTMVVGGGLVLSEDTDGLPMLEVTGASIPNPLVIPPVSNAITIRTNTNDGADNARMRISGSGDISSTRGAYLELKGNEFAGGGAGDAVIGLGATPLAKLHVIGGNIRHEYSTTGGSQYGFFTSPDQAHVVENAYFNSGWFTIKTGKGSYIQTGPTSLGYAFRVHGDNTSRATDAARTFAELFRIDLLGNTEAVGSASNTGKLKGNRLILPVGVDRWAT